MTMLAHLMLVVVASSAVNTRHVHVAPSDRYADQFVQSQSRDLNAYGQLEGYARHPEHGLPPKTNLNGPYVERVDNIRYISDRNQNLMMYPQQGYVGAHNFNTQDISQYGKQSVDNELERKDSTDSKRINTARSDNGQLSNAQGQGHEMRSDRKMYDSAKHETMYRNGNTRPATDIQERNNGVEPVTERKPFTNAPRRTEDKVKGMDDDVWIWSDKESTTVKSNTTDLEDRAAFSVDGCPTGKAKIAGSSMCVDKH